MSRLQCDISLASEFANLSSLERFIDSCAFLENEERLRILLIATEFFQNIVSYNRTLFRSPVFLSIQKGSSVSLHIRYATCNFSQLIEASETAQPHFDVTTVRYRGLGLLMCRNLAKTIQYKKGLFKSSVIIIL